MYRRPYLLLLAFLWCGLSFGQAPNLKGMWTGRLTQNEGGYRTDYAFEVYFQQSGPLLKGRTYVSTSGIYGEMTFTGQKLGSVLHLQEHELTYSRKPVDLAWCFKSIQLQMVQRGNEWYLEGPWQGKSEFGTCIPGWIVLKRVVPRA